MIKFEGLLTFTYYYLRYHTFLDHANNINNHGRPVHRSEKEVSYVKENKNNDLHIKEEKDRNSGSCDDRAAACSCADVVFGRRCADTSAGVCLEVHSGDLHSPAFSFVYNMCSSPGQMPCMDCY